jgi:hypothetical protein
MRKSHFNDDFLVLLGPIISRFFACSNEGEKIKQQMVHALVLSLCYKCNTPPQCFAKIMIPDFLLNQPPVSLENEKPLIFQSKSNCIFQQLRLEIFQKTLLTIIIFAGAPY